VVGITSEKLESVEGHINFDHMYYRQLPRDDDIIKSIDQSELDCVAAFEQTSDLASSDEESILSNQEMEFVASSNKDDRLNQPIANQEDDLNLSSFTDADLIQLTQCFDWVIDVDALLESANHRTESTDQTMDELDSSCLASRNATTHFTDDSFISTPQSNFLDTNQSYGTSKYNRQSSVQRLFDDLDLLSSCDYDQLPMDLFDVVDQKDESRTDHVESMTSCLSPSSSSGCESDFTPSCDDEQFPYSDDVGVLSFSEEPFIADLFPALC